MNKKNKASLLFVYGVMTIGIFMTAYMVVNRNFDQRSQALSSGDHVGLWPVKKTFASDITTEVWIGAHKKLIFGTLVVKFDPKLLKLKAIKPTSRFNYSIFTQTIEDANRTGKAIVTLAVKPGGEPQTGDIQFLDLTFSPNEITDNTTTLVEVVKEASEFVDEQRKAMSFTTSPSTLTYETRKLEHLYELRNNKEFFYTPSDSERDIAINDYKYTLVGEIGKSVDNNPSGTVPLYRLVGKGNHYFTTNVGEKDKYVSDGFRFEGVETYVYAAKVDGSLPLYRLKKKDDYGVKLLVGPSQQELTEWTSKGYQRGEIIGHIFPK